MSTSPFPYAQHTPYCGRLGHKTPDLLTDGRPPSRISGSPDSWLQIFGFPCDLQAYHTSRTTKRGCKAALIGALGSEAAFRALVGTRKDGLKRSWSEPSQRRLQKADIESQTFEALCRRAGKFTYNQYGKRINMTLPTLNRPDDQAENPAS